MESLVEMTSQYNLLLVNHLGDFWTIFKKTNNPFLCSVVQ